MKILVLSYEFPPIGGGGGRVAEEIAMAMAARGHEVAVHSARLHSQPAVERRDGLTIHRTYGWRRAADRCSPLEMLLHVIASLIPATRLALRWRPDVMHVHFAVPTGLLALIIRLLTGIPYVITSHLGDVPGGAPSQTDRWFRLLGPLFRPIWRHAADTTGVSAHIGALIRQAYGRETHNIPNGVDFTGLATTPRPAGHPRRLVFAGRFNPQKNVPFLVEALRHLPAGDWVAELIGDGVDYPAAAGQVKAHGLQDRIILHGWQSPEFVDSRMAEADVLLLPSLFEGFPVVAVKALGHGLAILTNDIDSMRPLVTDGRNGVLAPVGDRAAFTAALERIIRDDAGLAAMKAAALERAGAYSLPRIVDRYETVLAAAAGFLSPLPHRTGIHADG